MPCSSHGPSGGTRPASSPRTAQAGKEACERKDTIPQAPRCALPTLAMSTHHPQPHSGRQAAAQHSGVQGVCDLGQALEPPASPPYGCVAGSLAPAAGSVCAAPDTAAALRSPHQSHAGASLLLARRTPPGAGTGTHPGGGGSTGAEQEAHHLQPPSILCLQTFGCLNSRSVAMMAVLITAALVTLAGAGEEEDASEKPSSGSPP